MAHHKGHLITLIEQEITPISTLYIPALKGKEVNKEMLITLGSVDIYGP